MRIEEGEAGHGGPEHIGDDDGDVTQDEDGEGERHADSRQEQQGGEAIDERGQDQRRHQEGVQGLAADEAAADEGKGGGHPEDDGAGGGGDGDEQGSPSADANLFEGKEANEPAQGQTLRRKSDVLARGEGSEHDDQGGQEQVQERSEGYCPYPDPERGMPQPTTEASSGKCGGDGPGDGRRLRHARRRTGSDGLASCRPTRRRAPPRAG